MSVGEDWNVYPRVVLLRVERGRHVMLIKFRQASGIEIGFYNTHPGQVSLLVNVPRGFLINGLPSRGSFDIVI